MKPRVAVLIYSLAAGGAERVVSLLLPELMRYYEVTLVLMNETIFYEVPEGVKIHYLERSRPDEPGWKKLLKLPLLAWRYRRFCRKEGIGLSVSFMTRPNYLNSLSRILGSEATTVLSERAHPSKQYGDAGVTSRINRRLIRLLYPHAECILANSLGNKGDLHKKFGIEREKISVIYNPVDLKAISEAVKEPFAGPEFGEEAFVYLTVGRMDRGKNHRMLLEAFATIDADDRRLVLVGDGPLRSELESQAASLGISDRVVFAGRQRNPFVWMARADCFVFASRHEGFPNVLVEALACALPVISTDCLSGPREILDERSDYARPLPRIWEGRYGILTAVDDVEAMAESMQKMYNDAQIRKKYRESGPVRAKEFSIEKIASQYLKLLETTLKGTE
ncbi:glycosyltransferase [Nitratifractor sp.]